MKERCNTSRISKINLKICPDSYRDENWIIPGSTNWSGRGNSIFNVKTPQCEKTLIALKGGAITKHRVNPWIASECPALALKGGIRTHHFSKNQLIPDFYEISQRLILTALNWLNFTLTQNNNSARPH